VTEVVDYIRNQEEHHRKFNYQEEFMALLRKRGVEYDERYILAFESTYAARYAGLGFA
jgi:putative transposase